MQTTYYHIAAPIITLIVFSSPIWALYLSGLLPYFGRNLPGHEVGPVICRRRVRLLLLSGAFIFTFCLWGVCFIEDLAADPCNQGMPDFVTQHWPHSPAWHEAAEIAYANGLVD